jgi:hypothetical protein
VFVCGAARIELEKAPLYSVIPEKAGIRGGVGSGLRRSDENTSTRPVPATGGWQRAVQPSYPAPVTVGGIAGERPPGPGTAEAD